MRGAALAKLAQAFVTLALVVTQSLKGALS